MNDAKKHYRSMEDAKSHLEMELAKAKKEVHKEAVFCLPSSRLILVPWWFRVNQGRYLFHCIVV